MSYQKKHEASRMINRVIELITLFSTSTQSGVNIDLVKLMLIQRTGEATAILNQLDSFIHANELVNKREGELAGERDTMMTPDPRPEPQKKIAIADEAFEIRAHLDSMTVQDFIKLLRRDTELRRTYHDNIAMSFKDNVTWYRKKKSKRATGNYLNNQEIHAIANNAAKHFLDLLLRDTHTDGPDKA